MARSRHVREDDHGTLRLETGACRWLIAPFTRCRRGEFESSELSFFREGAGWAPSCWPRRWWALFSAHSAVAEQARARSQTGLTTGCEGLDMDVTPVLHLIGSFSDAGRAVAPALAGLSFVTSALQFLVAH